VTKRIEYALRAEQESVKDKAAALYTTAKAKCSVFGSSEMRGEERAI